MAKILHNGIVFAIFAHHIGLLNQNFFGCPKFVAFRPVQILRHYPSGYTTAVRLVHYTCSYVEIDKFGNSKDVCMNHPGESVLFPR